MNEIPKIKRPIVLVGKNIFLKDLKEVDVTQDYVDWMNDPEVVQYTESRFGSHTMDSTRAFVKRMSESLDTILFGIFSKKDESHIGNIKIGPINPHHLTADIGLIVGRKSFWGQSVGSNAISLVRDYAFSELQLAKITAGCYACNLGSARAFLKVGFSQEAVRPQHFFFNGNRVDAIELGSLNPLLSRGSKDEKDSCND